jgi:hypothetical protein
MTNHQEMRDDGVHDGAPRSVLDALLVYAEPLAAGAHVVVFGASNSPAVDRMLEFGARSVLVFDPDPARAAHGAERSSPGVSVRAFRGELDVRAGTFDLAIVPDLSDVEELSRVMPQLRRALTEGGALVGMGRATLEDVDASTEEPFEGELGPARVSYGDLYEGVAAEFDTVSLAGVLPFRGIVFAELGSSSEESPAVSVDTRLAPSESPSVFVVVASKSAEESTLTPTSLDPYAIVQLPGHASTSARAESGALEAALATAKLGHELIATQLEQARERILAAEARVADLAQRAEHASFERDAALARAMDLDGQLAAAKRAASMLEQRLAESDQLAEKLTAERARSANLEALAARAEQAEAALTLHVGDLAHVVDAHAVESAAYEEQLRERARVIAGLERELLRREGLVRELVTALEEMRDKGLDASRFEAPPVPSAPHKEAAAPEATDVAHLKAKLDALALEIARREGELMARAWRIAELERQVAQEAAKAPVDQASENTLRSALVKAEDELQALRQALAQEHAARVAAESAARA